MGRRALRKIPPTLDLSKHLKTVDEVDRPFDLDGLFANAAPWEVEVGSGKGLFLATAAGLHTDRNYLGCEIAQGYARFAAAKLARQQRENAVMLHGDGLRLFREILPDASLAAVHVYFPDPWWKKRHRKRRVMNEPFLKDVQRTLAVGGSLHFWTDVLEYFESTLELIAEVPQLDGPRDVPETPSQHDLDYRTHFERRMRLHDLAVYRSEFVRVD